jgi:hypothetical protein
VDQCGITEIDLHVEQCCSTEIDLYVEQCGSTEIDLYVEQCGSTEIDLYVEQCGSTEMARLVVIILRVLQLGAKTSISLFVGIIKASPFSICGTGCTTWGARSICGGGAFSL